MMAMDKQMLRKQIRQLKRTFTPEQLREMSTPITATLLEHPRIKAANTILLYASLPDEVDTHCLMEQLLAQGKNILLPVVVGDHDLKICPYKPSSQVAQGPFGIMEPQADAFTAFDEIDVALIPGMAFDKQGNRLGRGKGYYDRFLSTVPHLYKIGVCFPFQQITEVPADENDIRMDEVVVSTNNI